MKEVLIGLLASLCGIGLIWAIGRLILGKSYDKEEKNPITMGLAIVFALSPIACAFYIIGSLIILKFK